MLAADSDGASLVTKLKVIVTPVEDDPRLTSAPVTSVELATAGEPEWIDLWESFADPEDGAYLTYAVTDAGNATLFAETPQIVGNRLLKLVAAEGMLQQQTAVTIEGTDQAGRTVQLTITVDVDPVNVIPTNVKLIGYLNPAEAGENGRVFLRREGELTPSLDVNYQWNFGANPEIHAQASDFTNLSTGVQVVTFAAGEKDAIIEVIAADDTVAQFEYEYETFEFELLAGANYAISPTTQELVLYDNNYATTAGLVRATQTQRAFEPAQSGAASQIGFFKLERINSDFSQSLRFPIGFSGEATHQVDFQFGFDMTGPAADQNDLYFTFDAGESEGFIYIYALFDEDTETVDERDEHLWLTLPYDDNFDDGYAYGGVYGYLLDDSAFIPAATVPITDPWRPFELDLDVDLVDESDEDAPGFVVIENDNVDEQNTVVATGEFGGQQVEYIQTAEDNVLDRDVAHHIYEGVAPPFDADVRIGRLTVTGVDDPRRFPVADVLPWAQPQPGEFPETGNLVWSIPQELKVWRQIDGVWIEAGPETVTGENLDWTLAFEGLAPLNDGQITASLTWDVGPSDDDDITAHVVDRDDLPLYVCINGRDRDADGLADYYDGFNAVTDGYTSDDQIKPDGLIESPFEMITVPVSFDLASNPGAKFRFDYSSSDPSGVFNDSDKTFSLAGGKLRLWTKDAFNIVRDAAEVDAGGDYVASAEYSVLDLVSTGDDTLDLFVEGVAVGADTLTIELSLDGTAAGYQTFYEREIEVAHEMTVHAIDAYSEEGGEIAAFQLSNGIAGAGNPTVHFEILVNPDSNIEGLRRSEFQLFYDPEFPSTTTIPIVERTDEAGLTRYYASTGHDISRYSDEFNLIFRMSTKSGIDESEIRGPTVFKRDKDVEYTVFLPFRGDHCDATALHEVVKLLISGIVRVLDDLGFDSANVSDGADDFANDVVPDAAMIE